MPDDSPGMLQVSTSNPTPAATEASAAQPGNVVGGESPDGQSVLSKTRAVLNVSLSRFQSIVGLLAGLVSVIGAVLSVPQFFNPAPGMGEVVAVVQEAKSEKAVADATIEILTSQNALVSTLTPNSLGQVRHTLKEGPYRVRVSHPRFSAEVRQIQVFSGQTVEVRVRLHTGSSSPLAHVERAVSGGVRTVRRLLGL